MIEVGAVTAHRLDGVVYNGLPCGLSLSSVWFMMECLAVYH